MRRPAYVPLALTLIPLAVVIVLGLMVQRSARHALASAAEVERSFQVSLALNRLLARLTDAETAQRGYVITGAERFLEPYHNVRRDVLAHQATLHLLIRDPEQQRRLRGLEPVVERRLDHIDHVIMLRRAQRTAEAVAVVESGAGKALMDEVRRRMAEVEREQDRIQSRRQGEERRYATFLLPAIWSGLLLSALVAVGVNFLLAGHARARERQARDIEERNVQLEEQAAALEASAVELREAHAEVLKRLADAAEYRDQDTGDHAQRVGRVAARLAEAMGLPPETVELIRQATPLHDVGKIAVPDSVLCKPGELTEDEWKLMRRHTTAGAELLSGGATDLMRMAEQIALAHHERWDGTGYPQGLAGEEIPIAARIVSVADVFDALTSDRPYRDAWPREKTLALLRDGSGRAFDPQVVQAFEHITLTTRV